MVCAAANPDGVTWFHFPFATGKRGGQGPGRSNAPAPATGPVRGDVITGTNTGRRSGNSAPAPMTGPGSGLAEALPGDGNKLPAVRVRRECELQHAVDVGFPHFAIGLDRIERKSVDAAGSHGELTDAVGQIRQATGRLRREPLVEAIMAVQHDLGTRGVERIPERLHLVPQMNAVRAEARLVPDADGAALGAVVEIA